MSERLADIRSNLLAQQLLTFTKRPYTSWQLVNHQEKSVKSRLASLLAGHGHSLADLKLADRGILENYQPQELEKISKAVKDLRVINQIKKVVNTQYNSILTTAFPDGNLDKLEMIDKEQLYTAVVYYDPELNSLTLKDLNQLRKEPPMVFSSEQHQAGLNYLLNKIDLKEIPNHDLQRVLKHDGTRQLFLGECWEDSRIGQKQIVRVQTQLKR